MGALTLSLWIFGGACVTTWLLSVITREYSWVDRLWSIVPVAYLAVFAASDGFGNARLNLMLALVALWGARLTFNFARKGGFAPGGEDYRWRVLRERMPGWQFQVFNVAFISIYQNLILLLISLPAYTALQHTSALGWPDLLAAGLFLTFLVGETVADQQQWDFHQWKRREVDAGHEPWPRFLQTGLFRYARHPNFFCEQAQWWVIFAFAAIAANTVLLPTIVGPVLLTLLFIGSTKFTESITRSKYPEYAQYQATTPALIPRPRFEHDQPDVA
jgi:steroid 5-alpha reductase family enzyme